MIIDISKKSPYEAVIDKIHELTGNSMFEYLVRLKTTILGESNELLMIDKDEHCWEHDWYEGGEVELLGFIDIEEINVPKMFESELQEL